MMMPEPPTPEIPPGAAVPSEPTPSDGAEPGVPPVPVWKYVRRLGPLVVLWALLAGLLGWVLYTRAEWGEESDRAAVREWVENTRIFRKTLGELVHDYAELLADPGPEVPTAIRLAHKRDEIAEHILAMTEPTRAYASQLPLFPEIFRFEVAFEVSRPVPPRAAEPVGWVSPKPRPAGPARSQLRTLELTPPTGRPDVSARVTVEYRLHTYNQLQQQEYDARFWLTVAAAVVLLSMLVAGWFVARFLQRERRQELDRWRAAVRAEHRERELLRAQVERQLVEKELLEAQVRRQQAERAAEELNRKVLEQQLEAARLESRAAEAERTALELQSQLYASIGIMAGSYAHNIKNLLVRPNDLLARCIQTAQTPEQLGMLQEVRATLGTVTERLQQILKTVRRDPAKAEITQVDLAALVHESQRTWFETGRDKWRVTITAQTPDEPLWVRGDASHIQQAVENLLFNARDAMWEMQKYLRDEAYALPRGPERNKRILEAAAWRGEVTLRAYRDGGSVVLEVRDNGIGMTEEVKKNCLKAHFSTKRDNALYTGHAAGMGLGLSFVAVVLRHHGATLDIETAPLRGTTFRVRFPAANTTGSVPDDPHPPPTPLTA